MSTGVIDTVNSPRHPFGLPQGTVRGFLSLLICGFVWMVLLWHSEAKLPLSQFFLMALVLMAFSTSPHLQMGESKFIPWVLRVLFVGGSVGVVLYALFRDPQSLAKLTPDQAEFAYWWGPFLGCLTGGFFVGLLLRFILGRENQIFQTIRAWLSVIGLLMMTGEFVLFLMGAHSKPESDFFVHNWQAVQLAIVSAYFGTRA
jgi:hypothetical protein